MAELNTAEPKKGNGKVRSKKQDPHVDLTAMVDLAFLLITFFILTTTLSKPQSMNLAMPDKFDPEAEETKVADNRTVTLLLGSDDKLVWYLGQFIEPFEGPEVQTYGKNGIRNLLLEKKQRVLAATQDETKGLIVIIKPSDKSNYRNLVDILDEMIITNINTYAIVDISPEEVELLQEMGLD